MTQSPTLTHKQAFKFLTEEDLKRQVPCIYTNRPSSRTSFGKIKKEKFAHKEYVMTPTTDIINELADYGWRPVRAVEMRAKKDENVGFQKHFIHFRSPKLFVGSKQAITDLPELVIVNSYDGRCALKMYGGIYRVACSNGLIIKSVPLTTEDGSDCIRLAHNSGMLNDWPELSKMMLKHTESVIEWINMTKQIKLSPDQERKFAQMAMRARWDYNYKLSTTDEVLRRLRHEDEGHDFYTVFNVVQEKLMRGGFKGVGNRAVKPLKNPDREMSTNRKLYQIAEEFLETI